MSSARSNGYLVHDTKCRAIGSVELAPSRTSYADALLSLFTKNGASNLVYLIVYRCAKVGRVLANGALAARQLRLLD
ncbi:hypothetical protein BURKHO8Y_280020 [Burkholderia sp. 8Y]|nr:hypothetical protein BURKHO8Y_280020 [Burkholderia sp. 8Y]